MITNRADVYIYNVGWPGLILLLCSSTYIFAMIAFYISIFTNVGVIDGQELDNILVWSSLKPIALFFIMFYTVTKMFEDYLLLILLLVVGVVWVGTLVMGVQLVVTYATTCNTPSDPKNLCNDLAYCCVYYDSVPSCQGFGPCINVTQASDLSVNEDFQSLGGFTAIFFVLEIVIIVLIFKILLTMKQLRKDNVLVRRLVNRYYYGLDDEDFTLFEDNDFEGDLAFQNDDFEEDDEFFEEDDDDFIESNINWEEFYKIKSQYENRLYLGRNNADNDDKRVQDYHLPTQKSPTVNIGSSVNFRGFTTLNSSHLSDNYAKSRFTAGHFNSLPDITINKPFSQTQPMLRPSKDTPPRIINEGDHQCNNFMKRKWVKVTNIARHYASLCYYQCKCAVFILKTHVTGVVVRDLCPRSHHVNRMVKRKLKTNSSKNAYEGSTTDLKAHYQ